MSDLPFTYLPGAIQLDDTDKLVEDLKKVCQRYTFKVRGNTCKSNKASCLVLFNNECDMDANSGLFNYDHVPTVFDSELEYFDLSIIREIKEQLESMSPSGAVFDYCLIHLYEKGTDNIGWHSDRGNRTEIASANFGIRRKFRLREKHKTTGYDHEYELGEGDVIFMHGETEEQKSCQDLYKHCVPMQKTVKGTRVNMTFRS